MRRNRRWRKGRRGYQALYWGIDGLYTLTVSAQRCVGYREYGFITFRQSLRGRLVTPDEFRLWGGAANPMLYHLHEGNTVLYTPDGAYSCNNEGRVAPNGRRYYTFWRED